MPTLTRKFPRARKATRCMECRARIEKGERYHYWKGTADEWDGIATLKECERCASRYGRWSAERSEAQSAPWEAKENDR